MGGEDESEIGGTLEQVFREEAGKIVSILTGFFGLRNLELVEDAVQEAFLKALRQWSYGHLPQNRLGWLLRVARNHALDVLRRDTRLRQKESEIISTLAQQTIPGEGLEVSDEEIKDDQLRMIFACCDPVLPEESQIALTLKTLCGFGIEEIARAFLTSRETIAKRLTRARHRLKNEEIGFAIPMGNELSNRLEIVLAVVYLLFNEGYNASQGPDLIRRDLCDEALRLARLLQGHPVTALPKTEALLALMLFQAARFPSRHGVDGELLLLRGQDRSQWSQAIIVQGMVHLGRSATGAEASTFHLQAAIAACHCNAPSYEATDWAKILSLYDLLLQISHSPVIALNRAVAVAEVHGPEAGLRVLREIGDTRALRRYYLYYAVLADFCVRLKKYDEAAMNYRQAAELTELPAEQTFLAERLQALSKN